MRYIGSDQFWKGPQYLDVVRAVYTYRLTLPKQGQGGVTSGYTENAGAHATNEDKQLTSS